MAWKFGIGHVVLPGTREHRNIPEHPKPGTPPKTRNTPPENPEHPPENPEHPPENQEHSPENQEHSPENPEHPLKNPEHLPNCQEKRKISKPDHTSMLQNKFLLRRTRMKL